MQISPTATRWGASFPSRETVAHGCAGVTEIWVDERDGRLFGFPFDTDAYYVFGLPTQLDLVFFIGTNMDYACLGLGEAVETV